MVRGEIKMNEKTKIDNKNTLAIDEIKNTVSDVGETKRKYTKRQKVDDGVDKEKSEAVNRLFNTEICGELGGLPGEILFIGTGFEDFKFSDEEKKAIAPSVEICLKAFKIFGDDPKYIALGIMLISYVKILGMKGAKWQIYKANKKKEEEKKKMIFQNQKESPTI